MENRRKNKMEHCYLSYIKKKMTMRIIWRILIQIYFIITTCRSSPTINECILYDRPDKPIFTIVNGSYKNGEGNNAIQIFADSIYLAANTGVITPIGEFGWNTDFVANGGSPQIYSPSSNQFSLLLNTEYHAALGEQMVGIVDQSIIFLKGSKIAQEYQVTDGGTIYNLIPFLINGYNDFSEGKPKIHNLLLSYNEDTSSIFSFSDFNFCSPNDSSMNISINVDAGAIYLNDWTMIDSSGYSFSDGTNIKQFRFQEDGLSLQGFDRIGIFKDNAFGKTADELFTYGDLLNNSHNFTKNQQITIKNKENSALQLYASDGTVPRLSFLCNYVVDDLGMAVSKCIEFDPTNRGSIAFTNGGTSHSLVPIYIGTPTAADHAATKNYVDTLLENFPLFKVFQQTIVSHGSEQYNQLCTVYSTLPFAAKTVNYCICSRKQYSPIQSVCFINDSSSSVNKEINIYLYYQANAKQIDTKKLASLSWGDEEVTWTILTCAYIPA